MLTADSCVPEFREFSFAKLHGARNDFVFIPLEQCAHGFKNLPELRAFVQIVCGRRSHVGADGILIWDVSAAKGVRILILNSDGSLAATCGNALRCLGHLLLAQHLWSGLSTVAVSRLGVFNLLDLKDPQNSQSALAQLFLDSNEEFGAQEGVSFATLLSAHGNLHSPLVEVSVAMGSVQKVWNTPVHNDIVSALISKLLAENKAITPRSYASASSLNVFVQLANPHWVVFSPEFALMNKSQQEAFGHALQHELRLATQVQSLPVANIGLLFRQNDSWHLVVYERGAGLTECCGSGACAARVALEAMNKSTPHEPAVAFKMPGGNVQIGKTSLNKEKGSRLPDIELVLTGPSQIVAEGTLKSIC